MNNNEKKNYRKRKHNKDYRISANGLLTIPIIIIMCIIPFIVRLKMTETGLTSNNWFSNEYYIVDFFLYYKQLWIILMGVIMLIVLIGLLVRDREYIKSNKFFIPLILYGMLIIISSLFSKYLKFSIEGVFGHYESIFVHLSYIIMVVYCFYIFQDYKNIKILLYFFIGSILIMSILGVLQTFGYDPINTDFGLKMILPKEYWSSLDNVNLTFPIKTAYLTLYNPNYVGVYAALTMPLLFCIVFTHKNRKIVGLSIIILTLLMVILYGSKSEAGIIAVCISVIFSLFFLRKCLIEKWKLSILFCIALILVIIFSGNKLYNSINTAFTRLTMFEKSFKNLQEISTTDSIKIVYKDEIIFIDYDFEGDILSMNVLDNNDNSIQIIEDIDNNVYRLQNEKYKNITISPVVFNDVFGINIRIDNKDWYFTKGDIDGTYLYINRFGKLDNIVTAESMIFTGYETFASGRGYIWSRTIPLLKDKLVLGSGVETYLFEFPQQDYVGLYNYGFSESVLTKPHSLYLQMAVQSGILSLILFLVFVFKYLFSSFKLYNNSKFEDDFSQLGIGIFISIVAYLIICLANDSTITVAPIFWCLLGIGYAVNNVVSKKVINKVD
jgi:hypothetical protein